MFTRTALISTLAGLAAAAPAPRAAAAEPFTMIALHSGNAAVHLHSINANQEGLFINNSTQAFCPTQVGAACAETQNTTTVFTAFPKTPNTSLSMEVIVPGGQQAYVAPGGAVKYTIPHSGSIPPSSNSTGFEYTPQSSDGTVGKLTFAGLDFWACPNVNTPDVYQVFAASMPGFEVGPECISIALGTAQWDGKLAWEYN